MMDFEEGDGKMSNILVMAFSFVVITVVIVGFATSIRPIPGDPSMPTAQLSPLPSPPLPPSTHHDPICRKSKNNEFVSNCRKSSKSSKKSLVPHDSNTSPNLDFICSRTDHVSACKNSLSSVSNMFNGTFQDYVEAAIDVTFRYMNKVKDLSKRLANNGRIKKDRQALKDCVEMISLGIDDLVAAKLVASNASILNDKQSADLKNWVSAVLAYQESCRQGLKDRKIKLTMDNALVNPKMAASNALAILNINPTIPTTPSNKIKYRRLLRQKEKEGEYPTWFSAAKRKILGNYDDGKLQPDAVVAEDGTGKFRTIGEALKAYKLNSKGWYVIYVKAGCYNENVLISKNHTNVYIYGDGMERTLVYGSKHGKDGITAYQTAVFAVLGNGFVCKSLTIQNRATIGKETVALKVQADKAAIFNCKIEGSERTLYALTHRQFYRECIIYGSQDFIYGDSSTVIQKSLILIGDPLTPKKFNTIIAQGRVDRSQTTGFVLQDCTIIQDESRKKFHIPTYLARPGGLYSRTVILQSYIGNVICPSGWTMQSMNNNQIQQKNLLFAEFENHGPGADTKKRIKSEGYKVITSKPEANKYSTSNFIQGNLWLDRTGVPFGPQLL